VNRKSKQENNSQKLLTEVELELMGILWKLGQGSVTEVLEQLPSDRKLAYTSVSTILRILEQKEILSTKKEGRGHIYIPLMTKNDFEVKTLKHVVSKVFDGTPVALVRQLLNAGNIKDSEWDEIKKLIRDKGEK